MRKVLIVISICGVLLLLDYLQFRYKKHDDPRGNLYAGSKTCIKCHNNLYNSYLHTAHLVASLAADENTVHGSFAKGRNVFYVNANQKVVMEKLDSGLYQTYYLNGKIKERHRFDIVFGGVKGETYLYWMGDKLYQLPISYYTQEHKWSTSPGYGFNFLDYNRSRSIGKQCLECHASYISDLPAEMQQVNKGEKFDQSSLVYSIDCERCHGPGAKHVNFQAANPQIKTASFIIKYGTLTRGQKLDMCAVCHSGKPSFKLRSSFDFMPGDTFAKFKLPEFAHQNDTAHLDVHGNQLQLLQSSKCFINSKMDCATCHNTHQNSRGNDVIYTQKCLSCHNLPNHTYCKMTGQLSALQLSANCINCHMPALPTSIISVQVSDKLPSIQFLVHTHHIANYPQQVKKVLASIYR